MRTLQIATLSLLAMAARADTISFVGVDDDPGTLFVTADSPRNHGGILWAPGLALDANNRVSGSFLFGNPLAPSIADAFILFYNTFTDSRPAEIEIYAFPNVNLDPVGCIASIGCQMAGEGIAYTIREIDWADGTVDRIEFQWAHAPEPASFLMFLPAICFLLPRFRRMAAGKTR